MTDDRQNLIPHSDHPGRIHLVTEAQYEALAGDDTQIAALGQLQDFNGQTGRLMTRIGSEQRPEAWFGLGKGTGGAMSMRTLAGRLPPGDWALAAPSPWPMEDVALAFALGGYSFDRYRGAKGKAKARLVVGAARDAACRIADACALARDMINTPASDMGPLQIETLAREIADAALAQLTVTVGDALLSANYPSVHAVGRAAAVDRAPRMIELVWRGTGATDASPLVAVIGKGVTFDTGGLDLKPSSGMRWMKKDMGGAAHALALGQMIMQADLPIRLVVLVPAVENAVSGDAMRPGDVLATRKGLSVEVGNTDAEGRLVLSDALTRAGEHMPDLTIDLATLTGAARVALGPEVVPFYTDDDALAEAITSAAQATSDPLWRMPMWSGYDEALDSDIADLKNDPDGWAQAGSVTAALFLRRFAPSGPWVHLDIFAWHPRKLPGKPFGGEAQAVRALFSMIFQRYGAGE